MLTKAERGGIISRLSRAGAARTLKIKQVLLSNTLLSIGCPGVPGGAIACFAALSAIAGLPAGIMGVYISINTLCDMGATCCNVLGDIACSVAMKETCKLEAPAEK